MLGQYGLTAVPLYTGEEKWRVYSAQLKDGAVLQIPFSNYFPSSPYLGLSFFSPDKETAEDCVPNLEQYPVFFEVAQVLSDNRFHADRYRYLYNKIKKEGAKEFAKGYTTGLMGDARLKTLLLPIADIEYLIVEEENGFCYEIHLGSRVY